MYSKCPGIKLVSVVSSRGKDIDAKCTKMKIARAKQLFFIVKYANF